MHKGYKIVRSPESKRNDTKTVIFGVRSPSPFFHLFFIKNIKSDESRKNLGELPEQKF